MRVNLLSFIMPALVLSAALGQTKSAQETPHPPSLSLSLSGEPRVTDMSAGGTMLAPILCDHHGGIYVRVASPLTNIIGSAVTRLEPNGGTTTFDISKVEGLQHKGAQSMAVAVDPTGRLYAVVNYVVGKTTKTYLVSFWEDGSYKSRVALDERLMAYQLVPLPSDTFFIAGLQRTLAKSDRSMETAAKNSFAGIFDANGKMVRDLTSAADNNEVQLEGDPPVAVNSAIQLGSAQLGPDQNLYILKGTSPPRLQVLSISGVKLREHVLWTPFSGARPQTLMIGAGKVLVQFQEELESDKRPKIATVAYHGDTGEPIATYDLSEFRGNLACFEGDSFAVLTISPDRHFAIGKAELPR